MAIEQVSRNTFIDDCVHYKCDQCSIENGQSHNLKHHIVTAYAETKSYADQA